MGRSDLLRARLARRPPENMIKLPVGGGEDHAQVEEEVDVSGFNNGSVVSLAPGGSTFAQGTATGTSTDMRFKACAAGVFEGLVIGASANILTTATTRVRVTNLTTAGFIEATLAPGAVGPSVAPGTLAAAQGHDIVISEIVDAGGAGAVSGLYGGFCFTLA